ncbi:MAG: FecR domain-containing protein [Verrucomicrobiales bacterium]|nr:FecR domain-containing protein [Verrucomicrobiales bacterium]
MKKERLREIDLLSSRLIEGLSSDEENRRLNDLLKGDPEACERYLEISEIDTLLHEIHDSEHLPKELSELPGFMRDDPIPFPPAKSNPRRSYLAPVIAAAAAFAILLNISFVLWKNSEPEPSQATGIALLSRLVEPEWSEPGSGIEEGSVLFPGQFLLQSGLAQIEFFSGASVTVEGPVDLNLISSFEMECHKGKLRAFVPEPAQGFSVRTPDYEAVDLGTEFALSVGSEGSSEVHVVDGEVRLDSHTGETLQHLNKGDGIRSLSGNLESIAANESRFIGREQLLNRADANSQSRYERWRQTRETLLEDKSTLALFDFEGQNRWDRQLTNHKEDGPQAAIIGATWSEGRWPGKGALEFKGLSDRVRMQISGTFDALTFAAWIRIDGLDRWLSSLFLTDGFEKGEVHWQISDEGRLILGISDRNKPNSESKPVIKPNDIGRWMHIATTVDRNTGVVSHYLDGEMVASDQRKNIPPLKLGGGEIGNWQAHSKNYPIRSFNGRIDEFIILERAMSETEVAALHQGQLR